MSNPRIGVLMRGLASTGVTDHERAQGVGVAMEMHEELERLRTLALDLDATMRTLKMAADRDAKVNARTIYSHLERARSRCRHQDAGR